MIIIVWKMKPSYSYSCSAFDNAFYVNKFIIRKIKTKFGAFTKIHSKGCAQLGILVWEQFLIFHRIES